MDPYAALDALFSGQACLVGCVASLFLAVLTRVSTAQLIAEHNRAMAAMLHRLGKAESVIISQGDEIARLSGKIHDLELDADAWRTPTPQRLGIDVRGVG